MRVWVYPEKVHEELGAVRYQASWEQIKASASRRNRMIEQNSKRKHEREKHAGLLDQCEDETCRKARYTEIDPDADIDSYYKNFRGPDAEQKATEFAKKEVNKGKTAYGVVMVYKQVVDWYVEEDRIAEWVTVGDGEETVAE